MGYAGYTAAKLPPPLPSAVQAALWAVPSQDSLEIIEKLTKNVAVNPTGREVSVSLGTALETQGL